MAAASVTEDAPARTLNDLLNSNLSADAQAALFNCLAAGGNEDLICARCSCRSLRNFVDAHHECALYLPLGKLGVPHLEGLTHQGAWLQRWARCTDVTLDVSPDAPRRSSSPQPPPQSSELCLLPFDTAPEAACRRLESLHLDNASNEEPTLPGSVMLSLLRRVPSLHTLSITGLAGGHDAGDRAQACAALSSLSRLTTLSLYDYHWLPCIQPGLAARLTFLELGGAYGSPGDLTVTSAEVAAAVSLMPALEEVHLFRGLDFSAEDLRALLDALQPSVKNLRVQHAVMGAAGGRCTIPVHACLEGGLLQSFKINTPSAGEASAQEIFTFLEAALLPSRALGPRLPRLRLGLTLKAEAVQEEGAAAFDPFSSELYARCDDAWLWKLRVVAGSSSIDATQLLGEALRPRTLLWSLDGADFASVSLESGIWRNANAGDEAQAQAQGDGGQAQVQGAGGEGLGQGQAPGAGVEGDGEEDEAGRMGPCRDGGVGD